MFKLFSAIYLLFMVGLSVTAIGDTPSCEPFAADLPFVVLGFLAVGMTFAFLAGQENR